MVPKDVNTACVALLGHPHSLYGGTMDNKVITTLVRACSALRIPSLRFNFRGVGQSAGIYDAGQGESEDMLYLVSLWLQGAPNAQLLFAGFSFGSYVTYLAAVKSHSALLLSLAPPVHHFDFTTDLEQPYPWIILQGDEDEVVSLQDVLNFSKQYALPVIRMPNTGHFFHGKLLDLKTLLIETMTNQGFYDLN